MQPVVLFDLSYMMHRAFASGYSLAYQGKPTGLIYKFFSSIIAELRKHQPVQYIFAADSPPYLRSQQFEAYKAHRKNFSDDYYMQAQVISDFLQTTTTSMVSSPGFEADDILACYCQKYPEITFIIISSDQDLYQCITPNVSCYNPQTKKLLTYEVFQETYNILPTQWPVVKALIGDSSDNITGINGIGLKTALKYIQGVASEKQRLKIEAEAHCIQRNLDLITLPYPQLIPDLPEIHEIRYFVSEQSLETLYQKYGIKSLLKQIPQHTALFNCK